MGLVEVENLTYRYPGREAPAVRRVSFELVPGELVLLLGASGSGKSTLCRALNGLVPHFYGGTVSGAVRVAGLDTREVSVRDLALHVGLVFQDPENQLVTETPVSEVAFGLENLGIDRRQMRKRVEEVVSTLRLGPLKRKRLSELSGGQKQKVALASVLAMHPEVLVLDEPTSQLDPVSAEDFLATVRSLNDDLGLCVLLAEHRVERCLHFADRVMVLDGGELAFIGTPKEMSGWAREREWVPLPPITRLFLDRDGIEPPLTVKQGREVIRRIAGGKGPSTPPPPIEGDPGIEPQETRPSRSKRRLKASDEFAPLLEVRGLWHVYPDGTGALRGLDLNIGEGEFIAVIGENGSGKTTLVKHFNGLLKPTRGSVRLEGRETAGMEVAELARTCGMLGQNPNHQLIADTVEGELTASLAALGRPDGLDEALEETLETLHLLDLRHENPRDLSCGERTRVALASVLVYRPRLLVLDEPTRGVDQETKTGLVAYLKDYNRLGNTVVLVTHDLELAAECSERVVLLGEGCVLADGDKRVVLAESLFFTTQFNKSFRGSVPGVVTGEDARRALEVLL